jgi:hypothetical protein
MQSPIRLSPLPHTWLIDVDGTVCRHNGHLTGEDDVLPGVTELWARIPPGDVIIILSARDERYRQSTVAALAHRGLRVDHALFGLPVGERILINDAKPSGLKTAIAVNVARDMGLADLSIEVSAGL